MQTYLYKLILLFSGDFIPIILLLTLFSNYRTQILSCILLLFISIIINKILKFYYHIPLNTDFNSIDYAYPSGHMQASVVLYMELATIFQKKLFWIFAILINVGIAKGLIYYKYHIWNDVLSAVLFGLSIFTIYQLIKQYSNYQNITRYMNWRLYKIFITLIIFSCIYIGHLYQDFYYLIVFASLIVIYSQYNIKKYHKCSYKY